jgi:phosphate butyryltransferase
MIQKIDDLAGAAREALSGKAPPRIAVAAAEEGAILTALAMAEARELARPILLGNGKHVAAAAEENGVDLSRWELIREDNAAAAAVRAVELVRDGEADLVMKGLVPSAAFLRAVLRRDMGLNLGKRITGFEGTLVSHCAVFEVPRYHKLFMLTDGGLNIAPTVEEKAAILRNAVDLARCLGVARPKAALLAAIELVNPFAMSCTADAAILTQCCRRGQIEGCIVDGPLALDNAVSAEAAKTKGIDSPVAGDADILVVPNIEAGNILYKSLTFLGGAKTAALILGTRTPVLMTSRADSAEAKTASIALAVLSWLGNR